MISQDTANYYFLFIIRIIEVLLQCREVGNRTRWKSLGLLDRLNICVTQRRRATLRVITVFMIPAFKQLSFAHK